MRSGQGVLRQRTELCLKIGVFEVFEVRPNAGKALGLNARRSDKSAALFEILAYGARVHS